MITNAVRTRDRGLTAAMIIGSHGMVTVQDRTGEQVAARATAADLVKAMDLDLALRTEVHATGDQ